MANKTVQQIIAEDFSDDYQPLHQEGPDYIIPTEECRTWIKDSAVKMNISPEDDCQPTSTVTFFQNTVDQYPNYVALAVKRGGQWIKWTYMDYWKNVRTVAKAFIKLGLVPFHGLGILGFNSPEWVISYLAGVFAGGFSTGLYTTNSPEACFHVLNDCSANIAVVENEIQLQKILSIRDRLPYLKAIIQYTGQPKHPGIISWEDLLYIGNSIADHVIERRIKGLALNQCCSLVYTSGTTGNPKGAMLSHDSVIFQIKNIADKCWKYTRGDVVLMSYLPLSHIAALSGDIFMAIHVAASVYFASPDVLKGNLVNTMCDIKPTAIAGVPRVFEKIFEKIKETTIQMNLAKRTLIYWAQNKALRYHTVDKYNSSEEPLSYTVAKNLVLKKIRKQLGWQCLTDLLSVGAPLPVQVQEFFLGLDIPIIEGYGLTETCGPHIMGNADHIKIPSTGNIRNMPLNETVIDNPDETGCGEILLRGRNIFMGYLKQKEKTLEAIDDQGWLHTGDKGRVDSDGYLFITGRIKELIITSGGENIPPVIIEECIKKFLPIVSQCVLIGDRKNYLTMLITLKCEIDMDTLIPTDKLTLGAVAWCQSIGSKAKSIKDILPNNDSLVMAAIQSGIDKYNKYEAVSNAQKIQKWKILPQDFCIPNGEIGPTSKLKRVFITEKYSDIIDSMYK